VDRMIRLKNYTIGERVDRMIRLKNYKIGRIDMEKENE
jgi:hypothetical protein